MIAFAIDAINGALDAAGAESLNSLGDSVPLSIALSEWKEDEEGDVPRLVAYPVSEAIDYDLEQRPGHRSVANRVVTIQLAINGASLLETERCIHAARLAIHEAGVGSMVQLGGVWNRDTHTLEHGRKHVLTFTCKVPVTRAQGVPLPGDTVVVVEVNGAAGFDIGLATVDAYGVHEQGAPAAVWHCVFASESAGAFLSTDAGSPLSAAANGDRAVDITFATPRIGKAFFTIPEE